MKLQAINYNGKRFIYDSSEFKPAGTIAGDEIVTFSFYLKGKVVLKFQDLV